MELFYAWLALTVLYVGMVHLGGIEWIRERDAGPYASAPIAAWEKTWR